ncbi:MAG: phenylacetate-CoA oxygenase subunit PaaJ [Acidobacteriaceae bacterium]|nr:phenylacetate-CoA oxygenase subunit PaaJ [Acidobacteriaceae bacterium]
MVTTQPTVAEVRAWLEEIADPEIPVLSIVDLGILRDIEWSAASGEFVVSITPTYSGCPAIEVIADTIRNTLKERGVGKVRLETKLSPPWTTDWLTDDAKARLHEYGIAPPAKLIHVREIAPAMACPRCGSGRVELVSRFGSAPCKALYKCLNCLEPFDAFKQH